MANTFKFGNGNWAVKDGSVLAYNDENNNFKPLPFDFTRDSIATRVNRDGLIEVVPNNMPRIDFTDNASGHLLLEPTRTNLATYSGDIQQNFSTTDMTDTFEYGTAPNGLHKSTRLQLSNVGASRYVYTLTGIVSSGTTYNFSCYYKGIKGQTAYVYALPVGGTDVEKQITFTGDWQRVDITFTAGSSSNYVYIVDSRRGGNASDFEVWGTQVEAGSYATSYIPTEGSTVTRAVDDIELTFPNVDSFNSSSGFSVIAKFDIGATSGSSSQPFLYFNDDTSSTYMGFGSNTTNLRCRLNLSGTSYLNTQNAPRTQRNSLFASCDSSGWSQGANGSTGHTGTNNASVFDRLASITFITNENYGIIKISELLVYNTRLSNAELEKLTS